MNNASSILVWSLVLIGCLVGTFLLVIRLKRWLNPADTGAGGSGFTLSDLRQLHRNGQMSDDEFERAKSKIIEAAQHATSTVALRPVTHARDSRGIEPKFDQ